MLANVDGGSIGLKCVANRSRRFNEHWDVLDDGLAQHARGARDDRHLWFGLWMGKNARRIRFDRPMHVFGQSISRRQSLGVASTVLCSRRTADRALLTPAWLGPPSAVVAILPTCTACPCVRVYAFQ